MAYCPMRLQSPSHLQRAQELGRGKLLESGGSVRGQVPVLVAAGEASPWLTMRSHPTSSKRTCGKVTLQSEGWPLHDVSHVKEAPCRTPLVLCKRLKMIEYGGWELYAQGTWTAVRREIGLVTLV